MTTLLALVLILFLVAVIAGFVDTLAGGGGMLIIPVLLLRPDQRRILRALRLQTMRRYLADDAGSHDSPYHSRRGIDPARWYPQNRL